MTTYLYTHTKPGEPKATLNPSNNGKPFGVLMLNDERGSYLSFHTVADVLPFVRELAKLARKLDADAADDLLFDAVFGTDGLDKIRERLAAQPADTECRDYDPMYKLHGCERGKGHEGKHRDFDGNEWDGQWPGGDYLAESEPEQPGEPVTCRTCGVTAPRSQMTVVLPKVVGGDFGDPQHYCADLVACNDRRHPQLVTQLQAQHALVSRLAEDQPKAAV